MENYRIENGEAVTTIKGVDCMAVVTALCVGDDNDNPLTGENPGRLMIPYVAMNPQTGLVVERKKVFASNIREVVSPETWALVENELRDWFVNKLTTVPPTVEE